VCDSLLKNNFNITLIGRLLDDSRPIDRPYKTKRFNLTFNKGFLFYAEYNLRLFFFLLFKKHDIYHANDLDTLLPMWLVSSIYRKKLVYDTHEYFTGVPEIQNRYFVKKVWSRIEKFLFPKVKYVFTVNESISELYFNEYKSRPLVIRNLPEKKIINKLKSRKDLGLPENKKVVILQGSGINIHRGAEELLEAIAIQDKIFLCVVGKGDVINNLKKRSSKPDLTSKVLFVDALPYEKMMQYTINADVGVSLDKPNNLNYLYSLPNKVFDYLKVGIPIVCSDLVELSKIINIYNCGILIKNHQPKSILTALNSVLDEKNYSIFKAAALKVNSELNWENESESLINCYKKLV